MPVGVNDIVRIAAVVSMQAQEFLNVHHFKVLANATVDDAAFMVSTQLVLASIYADPQNDQSTQLRYERIEGQNITQNELLPTTNWAGNPTGNDVNHPLPLQTSANVFWPTITPKVRCTAYLPGYTETANGPNATWSASSVANMQLFGDALVGDIVGAGITLRKGAYNLTLDRFTELIGAFVPPDARTQRRRRPGVGI